LLYVNNFQIFKLQIGHRPQLLGKVQGGIDSLAVDARGDRVALGSSVCSNCRGPVTVLSVPAGKIVSQIGGPTADNDLPSLSPDGKRLAFTAFTASTGAAVVWTASADGSDLQPLYQCGGTPEWSPRGDKILCSGLPTHPARPCCSLSYVSPQGGPSATLVPRRVQGSFPARWSPNGKQILYLVNPGHCCRLALVNVQTRKTRWLPRISNPGNVGASPQSAAWSPDSRQLLVTYVTPAYPNCVLLYRIAANGGKPHQIRNCP
jgi:dipeptidyl aminopeptidase/acylaminoacyl peptidase